jgi:hypothetical protein
MTAGTGSIASRGGGFGISSGTAAADRAGFDVHALSSNATIATTAPCLIRMRIRNLPIFESAYLIITQAVAEA